MIRERLASLRLRLWLLVLLAFMPAVGLMFYTAAEQRQHAVKEVKDQALRTAQIASSDQERRIDGTRYLLMALAHVPDVRDGDAAECDGFVAALLKDNPLYTNFWVADLRGDLICSAVPLNRTVNIADRSFFRSAIETRNFAIGEFQIGRVTEKLTIGFGYPVLDADGRMQAVV